MLKKTVTYTDFNGEEVTETLYFHFTKPELIKLQARVGGDLSLYINKLVANNDLTAMVEFLEDMILSSYGQKTADGKKFVKSKQAREEFEYSEAYAIIFTELFTDPEASRKFGQGLAATVQTQKQQQTAQLHNLAD